MDPITISALIAGGSQIVSGLGQYLSSKQANRESEANLSRIKEIYDKLKRPSYDENGAPLPYYDVTTLTPEDYKILEKAVPTVAARVREVAPTVIRESGDMRTGRSAQMDALTRLRSIGEGGADPEYLDRLAQSSRQAGIDSRARIDAILQSQARRGLLGSGNQMAAQLQGSTAAMDQQSQQGSAAAAESYRNQLQALRDSATLGGQVRSADMDLQGRNADIINAYNNRSAVAGQNYQNRIADAMTDANRYNVGEGQRVADQNVSQRNDNARYYQTLGNQVATQNYNNSENARFDRNNLADRKFNNDITMAGAQAGQYNAGTNLANQRSVDRGNLISGLMGGVGSTAMAYGANESQKEDRKTSKELADQLRRYNDHIAAKNNAKIY